MADRCNPMLTRIKQSAAIVEAVCGQGGSFTAADFGTRFSSVSLDVDMTPTEDDTIKADLSPSPVTMGEKKAAFKISIPLVGSGVAGTKPEWDVYMQGCATKSEVCKRIPIGEVTGGPFIPGEIVTQAVSLATGICTKGTQDGDTHLFIVEQSGIWAASGLITGSDSAATATGSSAPVADGFAYHPVSRSADQKTIAVQCEEDGAKGVAVGLMGTFTFSANSSEKATLEFTFNGVADLDNFGDAAMTEGVEYFDTVFPILDSARCVLNRGEADEFLPVLRSLSFDMAGTATVRKDGNAAGGLIAAKLTARTPVLTLVPEAMLAADFDIYGKMRSCASINVGFRLTAPDNEIWVFSRKAQIVTNSKADADGFVTYNPALRLCRTNGNDEFWIVSTVH